MKACTVMQALVCKKKEEEVASHHPTLFDCQGIYSLCLLHVKNKNKTQKKRADLAKSRSRRALTSVIV